MTTLPSKIDNVALCLWGGRSPGKRPSTKLAQIEVQYSDEIEVTFVRDIKARTAQERFYKKSRMIPLKDVVYSWESWPSPSELRRVKDLYLGMLA